MHIHILGICGTFMGSLALIAKHLGHKVTGSDENVYPPMSTQLAEAGIELVEGYHSQQLALQPDLVVVGNVIRRGVPVMEEILNRNVPYISGPQWLKENVLQSKWVLAVSGTHGKTTTATMLAWILEYCGMAPGFLIGGVPLDFPVSARLGDSDFFVIEADEYDTAFFDKRSKFVHYLPRTLVINNLEFDHADIFDDLAAIQKQFHHLVRLVPGDGVVLHSAGENAVNTVLSMGCWSETQSMGENADWRYEILGENDFLVKFEDKIVGTVRWKHSGLHSVKNALAAIAAARHVGVPPESACKALGEFKGVKRRMELLGSIANVVVYDDFAHHPTAIATTLQGLRRQVGKDRIIAVVELRSNTMRRGIHKEKLLAAVSEADSCLCFQEKNASWSLSDLAVDRPSIAVYSDVEEIVECLIGMTRKDAPHEATHVLIMSNGGFSGIHGRLLERLEDSK